MKTRASQRVLNDLTYRKMKKQLEELFHGKYAVIAEGKLIGIENSLDNAWALASSYECAVVTKVSKKLSRAKILRNSLRRNPSLT